MSEGFFYKERFYVGLAPIGMNVEDWTNGYNRARKEILTDLKEFELKRYSDMMRTLTKLREKLEGKLKE